MTSAGRQGKFGVVGRVVSGISVLMLRSVIVIALAATLGMARLVSPVRSRWRNGQTFIRRP